MPKLPRPERVAPSLREYNFAECPSNKLATCCHYEYLRSSRLILEAVARARAGKTDLLALSVTQLFGSNRDPYLLWAFHDNSWPRLPYLDAVEARELPREPKQKQQRPNLADMVKPWRHFLSSPELRARHVAVYIPPGQSLPRLKKAFGDYLSRDYPELLAKEPLDPGWRIQLRGRGSLSEQTRADLTSLSAWRLRQTYGYTVEAAIKLMGGAASESERRAFYRYLKRAGQKINALEEQLGQMARRGDIISPQK